jgi:hypothetical protein
MAEQGGSFQQILSHYFPNTALILLGEHAASNTTNSLYRRILCDNFGPGENWLIPLTGN